jgi:hypothetical protein
LSNNIHQATKVSLWSTVPSVFLVVVMVAQGEWSSAFFGTRKRCHQSIIPPAV